VKPAASLLLVLAVLAAGAPGPACANEVQDFLGWSPDGKLYGVRVENDGTLKVEVQLCQSETDKCDWGPASREKAVKKMGRLPRPASTGPRGETLTLEEDGKGQVLMLVAGGKKTPVRTFTSHDEVTYNGLARLGQIYWRPDGGAVACEVIGHGRFIVVARLATAGADAASGIAVAANERGMKRYRAKEYREAAEEFRAAIAADPSHVKAHYNLACVASLLGDKAAAIEQLEWLRRSSDPRAAASLAKAASDPDLAPIAGDPRVRELIGSGGSANELAGFVAIATGAPVPSAGPARALLARLTNQDPVCDAADEQQGAALVLSAELAADSPGVETVVASLTNGVGVFGHDKLLAASAPLGCTTPGASQDRLLRLSVGQVVPDADPEIVAYYANGGRAEWSEMIQIFKRRGRELVAVFGATIAEVKDGRRAPSQLSLDADGTLRLQIPGRKKTVVLHWDAATFAYR
jgi:hypothetical protein